jgi:hypothetical protein
MAREERPVSPEQVPEEARMYMAALQPHQDHPFVRRHFYQVTWISFVVPDHGQVDFFALEFRVGEEAALIWAWLAGNSRKRSRCRRMQLPKIRPRLLLSHVLLQEDSDLNVGEQALLDVLEIDPENTEARSNLEVLKKQGVRGPAKGGAGVRMEASGG